MANYPGREGRGEVQHPASPRPATGDDHPARQDVVLGVQPQKKGDKVTVYGPSASSSPRTDHGWSSSAAVPAWRRCARTSSTSSAPAARARSASGTALARCAGFLRRGVRQARRRKPQLQVAPRALRSGARGQLDRPPASSTTCCYENYLKDHPAPRIASSTCAAPMMNSAVIKLLLDLGVERENIMLDDWRLNAAAPRQPPACASTFRRRARVFTNGAGLPASQADRRGGPTRCIPPVSARPAVGELAQQFVQAQPRRVGGVLARKGQGLGVAGVSPPSQPGRSAPGSLPGRRPRTGACAVHVPSPWVTSRILSPGCLQVPPPRMRVLSVSRETLSTQRGDTPLLVAQQRPSMAWSGVSPAGAPPLTSTGRRVSRASVAAQRRRPARAGSPSRCRTPSASCLRRH